jgi:hypothetical protein
MQIINKKWEIEFCQLMKKAKGCHGFIGWDAKMLGANAHIV